MVVTPALAGLDCGGMTKRDNHPDPTMELSVSQLVVPKPPGPPTNLPVDDRSAWGQLVVGADEFAPAPKLPHAPRRRWPLVALAVVGLAGGAFAVYWVTRDDRPVPAPGGATPAVVPVASTPDAAVVGAAAARDAAVELTVTPDAAAAPIPNDAAIDAISGVAAPIAPAPAVSKQRPRPAKKPVPKPKPALKQKRR